jgi:hypothetical protein
VNIWQRFSLDHLLNLIYYRSGWNATKREGKPIFTKELHMGLFSWLAARAATTNATRRATAQRTLHLQMHCILVEQDDLMKLAGEEWTHFARDYYRAADSAEVDPERLTENRRDTYFVYLNVFMAVYQPPSPLKWQEPQVPYPIWDAPSRRV